MESQGVSSNERHGSAAAGGEKKENGGESTDGQPPWKSRERSRENRELGRVNLEESRKDWTATGGD
ncbi:uncharacterized protein CCOS01_16368 [Colletotrichum costaricense]|uniref:Uncharacterized protein n=2 Tax=Colletotrichum acutatum species complex TaxID=2707335 RepID=A0AAJ0DSE6_9PEZI|nr:uncharacterized protein CCOS01_16368 [Colletotrichum costaricense]XP_060386683.1 uncharacterized protein CTAM01_02842 [Colletotrichum tamarilloi]KAK1507109.1 hypothetical protein CCOS01_16368 [Colletotrichum costaricense]KAK1507730.1 hypothetical protein CTAM01_02842 [Colletotrichum tamarilloi]